MKLQLVYPLTAYFSPDQEFQGRTRDKQFEECNSWGRVPTLWESTYGSRRVSKFLLITASTRVRRAD